MFPHLGIGELLILLVVVLILFGPKRLPELAGSVGKSLKAFKQGMKDGESEAAVKPPDDENKRPNP